MNNEEKVVIKEKTKEFAHEITKSQEYIDFMDKLERFNKDIEAKNLLESYQQKQTELSWKGFEPVLMDELKDLQNKINENTLIQEYIKSQEDLISLLNRTNNLISAKLGVRFALLKQEGGGCCA